MKPPAEKKISYELVDRDSPTGAPMYALLDRLVEAYHAELFDTEARIAIAWCTSWKPDVDGRVTIGKCKKASDLDREVAPYDFVVLLSREFWTNPNVTEPQREALLDHELMHATVKEDSQTGEVSHDERGRPVFRTRKHDVEEFRDIVARHGLYKRELESFAAALRRAPLLKAAEAGVEALGPDERERFAEAEEKSARGKRRRQAVASAPATTH